MYKWNIPRVKRTREKRYSFLINAFLFLSFSLSSLYLSSLKLLFLSERAYIWGNGLHFVFEGAFVESARKQVDKNLTVSRKQICTEISPACSIKYMRIWYDCVTSHPSSFLEETSLCVLHNGDVLMSCNYVWLSRKRIVVLTKLRLNWKEN